MTETAYNFNYWCCLCCAHVAPSPARDEAPSGCENCGRTDIAGFVTLDEAEELSQEVLDDLR